MPHETLSLAPPRIRHVIAAAGHDQGEILRRAQELLDGHVDFHEMRETGEGEPALHAWHILGGEQVQPVVAAGLPDGGLHAHRDPMEGPEKPMKTAIRKTTMLDRSNCLYLPPRRTWWDTPWRGG